MRSQHESGCACTASGAAWQLYDRTFVSDAVNLGLSIHCSRMKLQYEQPAKEVYLFRPFSCTSGGPYPYALHIPESPGLIDATVSKAGRSSLSEIAPFAKPHLPVFWPSRSIFTVATAKGKKMGYSSPKKKLDLNEFLSKPGKPRPKRYNWKQTAPQPSKTASPDKPVEKIA